MTASDFQALLPILVLAATPVLVMLLIAIRRSHLATVAVTLAGLAASFAALWPAAAAIPRQVTALLVIDHYSLFYTGVIVAATFVVAILAHGYFDQREGDPDEIYLLLTTAALGAVVLVSSSHFASFFLGLEILSVPLYAMAAYFRDRKQPLEAGLKYLVLAAASAAFLLFGMALVYAEVGTMSFGEMANRLAAGGGIGTLLLSGMALMVTGIGFKLAVVPFHLWTPDVYEGAPAPVTAFIATVSKGGMIGLLLRYFYQAGGTTLGPVMLVITIIAIASMVAGNLLALLQNNVKRILAYSSIAHLGYMLAAFVAGGTAGAEAVTFYVVAYFITTLGAFGVITVLSRRERDADELLDYRGLFWRRPALAGVFTAMLLSLTGIPLTAGFIGKFYIVAAGASAAAWTLILVLVISSGIGVFYYLRIVVALYSMPLEGEPALPPVAPAGGFALAALLAALVWLGVFPSPMLNWVRTAVGSLAGIGRV